MTAGPSRAHQSDVTRKRSIVMALALAVAVTPALAAEHGGRAEPQREQARQVVRSAPPETFPFGEVFRSLERLRLHPGQSGLDAAETARKRPEPSPDSE